MNSYQKSLYKKFEKFRQKPEWPAYPPYHTGDYLEDYFIKFFLEKDAKTERIFIPVCWSACYINNKDAPQFELQEQILSLDKNQKYFTVSTHDDAPRESFPELDILCFSAGGNSRHSNVAIPVIPSKIPKVLINNNIKKDILASFVGSLTHPIRNKLISFHEKNSNFIFQYKKWSPSVQEQQLKNFIDVTQRSYFSFDPRGYGKCPSYRFYETMQLNTVPIHISDDFWLPWKDELDWNSFSILCREEEINYVDLMIKECMYSGEYEQKIKNAKKIYDHYFTLESICNKIMEKVNK